MQDTLARPICENTAMNAIYFDLDGTLLHLDREYADLVEESFRRVIGQCRAEWVEEYDAAFAEFFETQAPEPCRRAFDAVSTNAGELAETLLRLEMQACEPPGQARVDLAELGKRYRLGVVSNGVPSWQREKLRACGLDGYFDAVVTSYEAGAHKPAAAPFDLAEARLSADVYGMVGDSDADVTGARRQGWSACRYRGGRLREMPAALGWER